MILAHAGFQQKRNQSGQGLTLHHGE